MGRHVGSKTGVRQYITKICETCDQEFDVELHRADKARYCCRECQHTGHAVQMRAHHHKHGRGLDEPRVCPECNTEFVVPKRSKQICCSVECGRARQVLAMEELWDSGGFKRNGIVVPRKPESVDCETCGEPFCTERREQRFCSADCASRSFERDGVTLTCPICGKDFVVKFKHRDRKTCSRSCRTAFIGKSGTSIEIAMRRALRGLGLRPIAQYGIDRITVDLAFPRRRLVVECDGDYWHSLPEVKRRDLRRDKWLRSEGWYVMRFTETEINRNPQRCAQRVARFIERGNARA